MVNLPPIYKMGELTQFYAFKSNIAIDKMLAPGQSIRFTIHNDVFVQMIAAILPIRIIK